MLIYIGKMQSTLLIVESPTKVKSIELYLKNLGYSNITVLASFGHISNLLNKQSAIDTENNFDMTWQHTKQAEKVLPKIIAAAKQCDQLFIATDPDREGEAIGWHIINELAKKRIKLPTKRLLFYSITKEAIKEAMDNAQEMRTNLISAYLARLGLDFLVGFYISPLLWRKLPGCLSAGRVQSAALRNIVELEYERVQFKSKQYYTVAGKFALSDNNILNGKLMSINEEKFERGCMYEKTPEQLEELLKIVNINQYHIEDINKKIKQKTPPAPFITSTLQQEASNKLHFSPSMTMKIAQQLYEGMQLEKKQTTGLITYMRTDNVIMSNDAMKLCRQWITDNLPGNYLNKIVRIHKSKVRNAQEAHECIRPTDFNNTPDKVKPYLDDNAFKLYKLIWERSVASQMSNAEYEETTLNITNTQAVFKGTGNIQLFDGWLLYHKETEDKLLPAIAEKQTVQLINLDTESKETQPPTRYTAASLIARMEQLGIGRPSTFTKIVDTLLDRDYVIKQDAYLVPTQRSWFLIAFLKTFFHQYIEYEFTAQLEDELDNVSHGSLDWHALLGSFWSDFSKTVTSVKDIKYDDMRENIENMWHDLFFQNNEKTCPKCGGVAQVRFWHGSCFISCLKYPECNWTQGLNQTVEPTIIGIDPNTNQSIKLLDGQYGPYLEWEGTIDDKPKKVALPPVLKGKEITLDIALKLKSMPYIIGMHPETNLEIKIGFGRFGPYILYNSVFYPLKHNPLTIDFDTTLQALTQAQIYKEKRAKKVDSTDATNTTKYVRKTKKAEAKTAAVKKKTTVKKKTSIKAEE